MVLDTFVGMFSTGKVCQLIVKRRISLRCEKDDRSMQQFLSGVVEVFECNFQNDYLDLQGGEELIRSVWVHWHCVKIQKFERVPAHLEALHDLLSVQTFQEPVLSIICSVPQDCSEFIMLCSYQIKVDLKCGNGEQREWVYIVW